MARELARLQQELQSVQDTLAGEHNHFSLASQTFELEMQAAQISLAYKQKQFPSTTQSEEELQTVNGPSCSPAQAHQDELAAVTNIPGLHECSSHSQSLSDISADGSYANHDSFPYPSVDCIPEFMDTPVPDGSQQKLALPRSKPDVPRPQPKPRLSLKRNSKVPTSPDAISHQDSPVPSTTSGDVYCGPKGTPTLSDSNIGVSDEVETCIPSHVVSPDLNEVTSHSSKVREALSHVKCALSHAYAL